MRYNRVTVCACVSRSFIDREKVIKLAAFLAKEGCDVVVEPDLCEKIMERSPDLAEVASSPVIACFPRAVRALFDTVGMCPECVADIRNDSVATILDQLGYKPGDAGGEDAGADKFRETIAAFPVKTGVDAWYPTLDKARCMECGKCHDFCLFGVYTIEDGVVRVRNPRSCKNDCPACARMCPGKAIIFPKYGKSPINGGVSDEEQAVSPDTKAVYADALRVRLAERRGGVSLLKKEENP